MIPGQGDQLDNARRVKEFNLGVVLPVAKILRERCPGIRDNLLLVSLQQAFELHETARYRKEIDWERPRLGPSYCAKIIHAKLEEERDS